AFGVAVALYINQRDTNNSGTTFDDNQSNHAAAPALGEVDNTNGSENNNGNAPETSTVRITDDGFQPETIRIASGTTVTFENASSRNVWIASDSHPSHTDLPEFDAERSYAPGESYSYTFSQPGEWGYHDHLRSFVTGRVIVEE
ncbi:MAG: cupredoxin domain-containing protein, partial [Actinobacteria bacterium]|nr:cupredoxin domain-containing protein [Actinomycetota bacterium]